MLVTSRDVDVLTTVYRLPQIDRHQLERLHFGALARQPGRWASSVIVRRLSLLSTHGYLLRRRVPVQAGSGAAPYCYTLGSAAVPLAAERLDLSLDAVKHRQEADARLSFMLHGHRQLLADTFVALALGCHESGYTLDWRTEQDVAARNDAVTVAGKPVPIRPDAACHLGNLPRGGGASFFVEIQVASDPAKYLAKCRAYLTYYASGRYQRSWGYRSLRVLAISTSQARAENLCAVIQESLTFGTPSDKACTERRMTG